LIGNSAVIGRPEMFEQAMLLDSVTETLGFPTDSGVLKQTSQRDKLKK